MRFNKIQISHPEIKEKGIEEINITRLSSLVAFVGKNGSGKSRILDLLESHLFSTVNAETIYNKTLEWLPENLSTLANNYKSYNQEFLPLLAKLEGLNRKRLAHPTSQNAKREYLLFQRHVNANPVGQNKKGWDNELTNIVASLSKNYLRRIRSDQVQALQKTISSMPSGMPLFENLLESTVLGDSNEILSVHLSALGYLGRLPHDLTYYFNESFGNEKIYGESLPFKRYFSLQKYIKVFLNKELTWERETNAPVRTETHVQSNHTGVWKINGRKFNYDEFSNGEKTLFTYALLFFLLDQNPNLNLKECIILIDEPELHLHHESEIALIKALREIIEGKGQLIIATHSLNILSELSYDEIFLVKSGVINHPSQSTHREALNELMGLETRAIKLSDFLSSSGTWAFIEFISQCFENPQVIESARPNDPQIEAFKIAVSQVQARKQNLFLDFGAGRGRVPHQLKEDSNFMNKLTYFALEPDDAFRSKLIEAGANEVYRSYDELPNEKFDFILLCNVLHEIKIEEWKLTLNKIITSLAKDGFLIIIEVKTLGKGEKIGTTGFLLLDVPEIQKLFRLENLPGEIVSGNKSITCCVLSKKLLTPINDADVLNSLIELESNTLRKIKKLRTNAEGKSNIEKYHLGRTAAFLSEQHINAKLSREVLERS